MRLLDTIKSASETLERAGIADPLVDAELIVLHAAALDRLGAYLDNPEIDRGLASKISRLTKRRAGGEPLQYIIGHVDFLDLRITVGKGVLIPRPETELLAQEAIRVCRAAAEKDRDNLLSILDVCTGSGCIALSLAQALPAARVFGTDVSARALAYAKKNASDNGIRNITFMKGSLFCPVKEDMTFDLITANPPYIRTADIRGLQREIREWEPLRALDGGADGLGFYREILSKASAYLKKDGCILLELGFGQAEPVREIAGESGFRNITLIKDFSGIERVLKAEQSASQSSHLQG